MSHLLGGSLLALGAARGGPAYLAVVTRVTTGRICQHFNVGEVAYVVERRAGADRSRDVVRELRRLVNLDLRTEERVIEAARVKAGYQMAYADAFAVATALARGADLLTGDPEILQGDASWSVVDIRHSSSPRVSRRCPRSAERHGYSSGTCGVSHCTTVISRRSSRGL
jgi:predicted nucleic acid-binding protein